jgi:hypothetical protein
VRVSFGHACTSFLSFKSSRKSCKLVGLLRRASKAINLFSFAKIWRYYKSQSLNKTRLPITWIWSSLFWLTCSSPKFFVFDRKTSSLFMHVICTFCWSRWPLACWDCGFESRRRYGCLSAVSVVCCQVKIQRSPTDCGTCCVWSRNLVNEEALLR